MLSWQDILTTISRRTVVDTLHEQRTNTLGECESVMVGQGGDEETSTVKKLRLQGKPMFVQSASAAISYTPVFLFNQTSAWQQRLCLCTPADCNT